MDNRAMLCATCGSWLRCLNNDAGFGDVNGHMTAADLYGCPNCPETQVLTGFAKQSYSTSDTERQRHIEAGTYYEESMT